MKCLDMGRKASLKGTVVAFVALSATTAFADATLKVDLTDSIRTVTHCASGALYGITADLPADVSAHIAPLKGNVYVQPAISGNGHQQPIGDAFDVAKRLVNTTGKVQIRLADILPGWPYRWPGKDSWLKSVEEIIKKKLNSGLNNFDGYEIWNEPDGTWKNENGDFYTNCWKPTYDLIRKLDPKAKIIGPSYSWFNSNRVDEFLKYCSQNNCLPDVFSWHQWGSGGFVGAVESLRNIEKKYNISPRALSINEYSSDTHTYEGAPGVSVPYIAKFERYNVESAMISWWFTNLPGRLGSLLTASNQKGGGWWLYKWYGDMSGYMARVTPPNDKSEGVDGFAAVDAKQNYASLVLGGNSVGNVNVVFEKLPAFLGGKMKVTVERVTWKDKDTPVASTELVSEKEMTLTGSSLTVQVKIESQFYGYRVYLTPIDVPQNPYKNVAASIPGKVEAENYDEAGQGFSYRDTDSDNQGGAYRDDGVDIEEGGDNYAIGYTIADEWLEYTVDVAQEGEYLIKANVASGSETSSFQLFMDDAEITESFAVPQTGEDWKTYKVFELGKKTLTAGKHILKLAITGSYVNIDWIEFVDAKAAQEEEQMGLTSLRRTPGNTAVEAQYFDMNGNRVSKEATKRPGAYLVRVPGFKTYLIRTAK